MTTQRATGALLGSAVGDTLGASFAFGPEEAFSAHFPAPGHGAEFNSAVRPRLGSAVWALRTTDSYENAVRAAVDLGGDTDTVAAVTGGPAGASYGAESIPEQWTEPLHVPLPGYRDRVPRAPEPAGLARRLRVRVEVLADLAAHGRGGDDPARDPLLPLALSD